MYEGWGIDRTITERRCKLASSAYIQHQVRIESVEEYRKMPKIKPLNGTEIYFFEDGIEAVVGECSEGSFLTERGTHFYKAVLIDEGRKQIVKFRFEK